MSWRQDWIDRLDDFCGLNPQAIGVGKPIVNAATYWRNHAVITPRDPPPSPLAVAINYETGEPINDRQKGHLQAIKESGELLLECMHNAEGSSIPGQHQEHVFQMPRMKRAAEMIEVAMMLARRAVLEVK